MLILTRRVGETIRMGKDGEIEIVVLGLRGTQIRIGVHAPDNIPVLREEIYEKNDKRMELINKGNR